jgi:hypothetical protein
MAARETREGLGQMVLMRTYTLKKGLLVVIAFAALLWVLWMIGVIREAPPLISN